MRTFTRHWSSFRRFSLRTSHTRPTAGSRAPVERTSIRQLPSRLLEAVGRDAAVTSDELSAFRFLTLLHATVQSWAWVVAPLDGVFGLPREGVLASAAALTLCCAVGLSPRGRWAPVMAMPVLACQLYWTFPWTPNHNFLVFLCVAFLALLDPKLDAERRMLIQSLRWITVLVFFYAGLQKLLYGYWFRGEFLAWMIAHGVEAWRASFGWLVPDAELARLRSLNPLAIQSGPYRIDSVVFVIVSNAVYLAEMAIAVLLLTRRFRRPAALAAIGLVFLIQLAPREFMFALLYTQLLLLFVPGGWNRRLMPVFSIAYLYLLAVMAGLAPGQEFLKPNGTI